MRTFLTSLGVGWGIFMLVIMLGAGNGLKNGVLHGFKGTATNCFFMWAQKTTKACKGMKPGRSFTFNNADVLALSELKEVEIASPQIQLGGHRGSNSVQRGLKADNFEIVGVYPSINLIQPIKIVSGRFVNENDIREKRKVCIIGSRVKDVLFTTNEDPLGGYIRVSGVYFQVIGISAPTANGNEAERQSKKIQLPFTTCQSAFNFGDVVGWFAILSKKNVPASLTEEKAIALMQERHKIASDDLLAIGHWNMEEAYTKMLGLFTGINVLTWFVGIGTLIAGVIGISNIMLIVVNERTREIGVKRALGATPSDISQQIVLESVFLTMAAGYLGLVFGILLLEAINKMMGQGAEMFRNPTVDLNVALLSLSVLVISGALAGLIPARKAVAILPIEALRAE